MPREYSENHGFLHIDPDRLAATLMAGGSPEEVVRALYEYWRSRGFIRRAVVFLRHHDGWSRLLDTDDAPIRSNSVLLKLLALQAERVDGTPLAATKSTLRAYPLGCEGDESARLIVQPFQSGDAPCLPPDVFLALSLHFRAVRDREALDCVSNRQRFARPLVCRDKPAETPSDLFRLFPELVGRSSALAGVLDLVKRAAPRDTSVVIFGESGTGKELIGRAIHRLSARREQPFVTENCGALTESLLESELFGHEKGAFTGASSQRAGLFERANRGTVFLDEIGEMSAGLQTRLLRVLQERELRRVGGTEERSVDFRLIAATHRNLDDEARHGRFRLDLLYRMDVIRIRVPPLRERPEDIPALVSHFIEEFTTAVDLPPPVVPAETLRVLRGYPWPGNIRELRNEIERAVTLDPEIITPESLSPRIEKPPLPLSVAQKVRDEVGTNIYGLEKMVLGGIIREILTETGGNKTRAAQILGLPKTSLYRRMKRYGID